MTEHRGIDDGEAELTASIEPTGGPDDWQMTFRIKDAPSDVDTWVNASLPVARQWAHHILRMIEEHEKAERGRLCEMARSATRPS